MKRYAGCKAGLSLEEKEEVIEAMLNKRLVFFDIFFFSLIFSLLISNTFTIRTSLLFIYPLIFFTTLLLYLLIQNVKNSGYNRKN